MDNELFDALNEVSFGKGLATASLIGGMFFNPMAANAAAPPNVSHQQEQYPKEVRAIVGEAENQGIDGMRALASAIRNRAKLPYYKKRGVLHGVYGLHRKFKKQPPDWVWKQAQKAWDESASKDFVQGAQFWGTDADVAKFKTEDWFKKTKFVTKIKDHSFFVIPTAK